MNPTAAKVENVSIDNDRLTVWLSDGRVLGLPLAWYPLLKEASLAERAVWRRSAAGHGVHWPALDYDLSVEGLLAGAKEARGVLAYTRRLRARPGRVRRRPRALAAV
jgi:hypothetical protein